MSKKIEEMTKGCDKIATDHWKLAASDREQGYEKWIKEVKKVAHFVDIYTKNFKKSR